MNKEASAVKCCGWPWPGLSGYLRALRLASVGLIFISFNGAGNLAIAQQPSQPPAKVGNCAGLGAEGVFEDITPPDVQANTNITANAGGSFAMAVDPANPGTVYIGTRHSKLWKTTDCGATWTAIATGRNGADINRGMNWTLAIDPTDTNIVYTNSGYGSNGLYKSRNGGVDWEVIWPPPRQPQLARAFTYNFVNLVVLDPANRLHFLLTFHESCLPPHPAICIAETSDGGSTWRLIDGKPEWKGSEGQLIYFLENSQTWLWGSESNGFWRSDDSGANWEVIPGMVASHLQGSQLHRRKDGTFFLAASNGIWHSPDGKASNWKLVPNTSPLVGGLVSTGTTMYASTCYFPHFCKKAQYLSSPEDNGQTWTELPSPELNMGGIMAYEKAHRLIYSANMLGGVWRVVVRP
jgi:photosystem II stability/assembly factor-like uncharacterized protein